MIPWRRLSFGRQFTALRFARYYLLRLLPFPQVRDVVAGVIARYVSRMQRRGGDPGPDAAQKSVCERVRQCGFSAIAPLMSEAQIEESIAFLAGQPAYEGERQLFVTAEPCNAVRASYPVKTILLCPHLLRVINTPEVLGIAEAFLGCKPTIAAIGLNWSFPGARRVVDVQRFHRDCEAWRLLNMFVYLTDVDEGAGPHRYVLGSHSTGGRLRMTPYSESDVIDRYGKDHLHTIVGPRGTTFVENGWGIHEANPPTTKRRLILAVMYSVGPIPVYDYGRVAAAGGHPYDPYVNRLLFA